MTFGIRLSVPPSTGILIKLCWTITPISTCPPPAVTGRRLRSSFAGSRSTTMVACMLIRSSRATSCWPIKLHRPRFDECSDYVETIAGSEDERATAIRWPKPVAAYHNDPSVAPKACFDRDTGIPVPLEVLKTYQDALAQYHLRPENKFQGGNYADRGITRRRHVIAITVRRIGKESNRWEEQFYLGQDNEAAIDYGSSDDSKTFLDRLRNQIIAIGQRRVARESGVSRRTIERLIKGDQIRKSVLVRILEAMRSG